LDSRFPRICRIRILSLRIRSEDFGDLHLQRQSFGFELSAVLASDLFRERTDVHRFRPDIELARLVPRILDQIVDQLDRGGDGGADPNNAVSLARREIVDHPRFQEMGIPLCRAQRILHVVAEPTYQARLDLQDLFEIALLAHRFGRRLVRSPASLVGRSPEPRMIDGQGAEGCQLFGPREVAFAVLVSLGGGHEGDGPQHPIAADEGHDEHGTDPELPQGREILFASRHAHEHLVGYLGDDLRLSGPHDHRNPQRILPGGGHPSWSDRASRSIAGSEWTMARRRISPDGSRRSTIDHAPTSGSAISARARSVAS
jgi:hypothetical protein